MMNFVRRCSIRHWIILAVANFLLVASLGLLMRLKAIVPMAWANQKNLMHAHSHFAFSGWVSHTLMVFIVMAVLGLQAKDVFPRRYQWIIGANLLASFGMLVSFTMQGYGLYSIILSTITLIVSYVFAGCCWRDLSRSALPKVLQYWFKAALVFSVFSSLGTFSLVYLMASHQLEPLKQLASVYFYLHFQYNGWFFFACMGLLHYWLYHKTIVVPCGKGIFWFFTSCIIPAYFLSVLWWKAFPQWLYVAVVVTVLLQFSVWIIYITKVLRFFKQHISLSLHPYVKILWSGVMLAVFLKLVLQSVSVIPSLSQLVYGYRPIVVAYLHLVLLVIISLFLLGLAFQMQVLHLGKWTQRCLVGLVVGVLLNELILAIQGIGGLARVYIPATNEFLAVAAVIMVLSLFGILWTQRAGKSS